ncbi:MAG TPA: SRPBCC domain-containing protein [Thermohalobaculum sp.]|nr:SRPBCC domain-containing protein [Thermohalobaculum sp.]
MTDATQDGTLLVIRRSFEADIETLFRALTDAEAMRQWFYGPTETGVHLAESDLRPGGRWAVGMTGKDGGEHHVSGAFVEIDPPRRAVFTWAWRSAPEQVSEVTYELRPAGEGRTALTLTHRRLPDARMRDLHESGWNACLDRLSHRLTE